MLLLGSVQLEIVLGLHPNGRMTVEAPEGGAVAQSLV